jgi:hypothetical protein
MWKGAHAPSLSHLPPSSSAPSAMISSWYCICPDPQDPESPMCDTCLSAFPHYRSCRGCRNRLASNLLEWTQHYDDLQAQALVMVTRSLDTLKYHRKYVGKRTILSRLPQYRFYQDVFQRYHTYYTRCGMTAGEYHERARAIMEAPLLPRLRDVHQPGGTARL